MKIRRNQPCPCGSGKRFKYCCGSLKSPSTPSLPISSKQSTFQAQPVTISNYKEMALHFLQTGQPQKAEAIYRQILLVQSDLAEGHCLLGKALAAQNKLEEAIACYHHALKWNPNLSEAHKNLGHAFRIQGKLEESKLSFQKVLKQNPNDTGARIQLATLRPVIMGLLPEILESRQLFAKNVTELLNSEIQLENPATETGVTNFYFAYHGFNDLDLQVQLATLYEHVCPSLLYTAPHCTTSSKPSKNRPIKIGFISKYFRNHTIGKVICGIIANLSRTKFEVYGFFLPHPVDEVSDFIMQHVNHVEILPLVLEQARHQITEKELDILVYPDIGMDSFTYFLAFARLAPVQYTTWGHPVTSGLRNIDYFISTRTLEAEGAEKHYTEKLVYLNSHHLTFYYKPTLPIFSKHRHNFDLAEKDHIYLCPQALFKFHPNFDAILAAILERDPQGQVILPEGNHAHWTLRLTNRFKQTIPTAVIERLRFVPRMSLGDYFNLIALADVILDPFPFGGGNTSYETLAVGTPIVTLPTQLMCGRLTYACYRQIGVMECVAENPQHYIEIALRLGTQSSFNNQMRAKILAAHDLLYEDMNVVREFEKIFEELSLHSIKPT